MTRLKTNSEMIWKQFYGRCECGETPSKLGCCCFQKQGALLEEQVPGEKPSVVLLGLSSFSRFLNNNASQEAGWSGPWLTLQNWLSPVSGVVFEAWGGQEGC